MFKDYYAILEIDETAKLNDIKNSFKKQALKWHPDRNPGVDTTQKMQDINEAYLILKDFEARERYNVEYRNFKQFQRERIKKDDDAKKEKVNREKSTDFEEYAIKDTVLKKWMNNARRQAIVLAKETIEDMRGMISVATKAAINKISDYTPIFIIGLIIFIFLA